VVPCLYLHRCLDEPASTSKGTKKSYLSFQPISP
jgi:hypothetical protein